MAIDLYDAENLGKYIHRHARESKAAHQLRTKRIAYRNYIRAVPELYRHYIFSKKVERSALPKSIEQQLHELDEQELLAGVGQLIEPKLNLRATEWQEEFLKDVDRDGTPIDRFMGDLSELAFLYGKMYLLVDLPDTNLRPLNDQVRRELGLRPYFVSYSPLEAVNWQLDQDSKLL